VTTASSYLPAPPLAVCSDPELLVPGSIEGLQMDADQLEGHARSLTQHSDDLRHLAPARWTGDSADGWSATREQLADVLGVVSEAHATAAAVLRLHSESIAWGRARAEVAVAMHAVGCALTRGAGLPIPAPAGLAPANDPGAGHRIAAEDVLDDARRDVVASGCAAAQILDDLDAGMPDGRWHTEEFFIGIASWFAATASVVWKFSSLGALADRGGYARDLQEHALGARDLWDRAMRDPIGVGVQVIDLETLQDRPARWWGHLAPDIALSIAGLGGARLATVGLRAAGAAEDVGAELLSTAPRGTGAKLPITMDSVRDIAAKYGVDISDVTIRLERSRIGYFGSTAPDGTVALARPAFANEEQLARTLAHERFHVDQIRAGMGYPTTYNAANEWELAAQAFEEEWWAGR
jgi:hypothetical protein